MSDRREWFVPMYFIYSLVLSLGFLILLPRFILDAFRHGKYVAGFRERLGSLAPSPKDGRPVVWIHCVSVGETQAARPLVRAIKSRYPNHVIAISTITLTGQNLAREIFRQDADRIFYFPFDWRCVVRRTLKAIKPDTVLLMETELWPGFLRECKRQQIPVALVNGRLSEQSFRRYRVIRSFMKRVLSSINIGVMQTEDDAERFRNLGLDPARTIVSGNLKFDAGTLPATDTLTDEFRERFKLGDGSLVILAASTHDPEEVIVLNSLRQVISRSQLKPRLMIAPRHPERFVEVADLLNASGFRWARRTAPSHASDQQAEVILIDSIGELHSVYSLASIVFVGGSLAKTGGHNILEPAAVGAAVITGPHTYNFQSIVATFLKAEAIIQLQPTSDSAAIIELADTILELLADPARRLKLGSIARSLVNENRGATERTLQSLSSLLLNSRNVVDRASSLRAKNAPIG
jgi:3-deoxy-D-manno-octulosonic-acid transferase